jgi:hypothetical protein
VVGGELQKNDSDTHVHSGARRGRVFSQGRVDAS